MRHYHPVIRSSPKESNTQTTSPMMRIENQWFVVLTNAPRTLCSHKQSTPLVCTATGTPPQECGSVCNENEKQRKEQKPDMMKRPSLCKHSINNNSLGIDMIVDRVLGHNGPSLPGRVSLHYTNRMNNMRIKTPRWHCVCLQFRQPHPTCLSQKHLPTNCVVDRMNATLLVEIHHCEMDHDKA